MTATTQPETSPASGRHDTRHGSSSPSRWTGTCLLPATSSLGSC